MEPRRTDDHHPFADDRALADAVLGGDREAFRGLVEREASSIVSVCRRILGDASEAEDAAQEAFLIAFRKLGAYRGDGPLGAWVTRIAMREARDRALRRAPITSIDQASEASRSGIEAIAAAGRAPDDPALLAEAGEQAVRLRAAVAELPAHYADAVRMRYLDHLTFPEIAAATGRPEPTIRTHLHRGLARLRASLDEEGTP